MPAAPTAADRLAGVVAKVRKLRKLATSTNVNEAASAAAAADRIIQEHRLSEAQLGAGSDETGARCDESPILVERRRTMWRWHLASVVAEHYSCALAMETRPNGDRAILPVGTPEDIEIVRLVFSWVDSEIQRLAREAKTKADERREALAFEAEVRGASGGAFEAVRAARQRQVLEAATQFDARAFCLGAVVGISEALDASKAEAFARASTSTAMVLATRLEDATALLASQGITPAPMESSPLAGGSSRSFFAGVAAGHAIDVGGAKRPRLQR